MNRPDEATLPAGRPLTGRVVLLSLFGFFGTIIAANGFLLHYSIASFSGLETKNAYTAGLNYDKEIAAERVQDQRGWKVDVALARVAPGVSEVTIRQRDAAGAPTSAIEASVTFMHPADQRRDLDAVLPKVEPGVYRARVNVGSGRWDVVTELQTSGNIVFRSKNQIMIDDKVAN